MQFCGNCHFCRVPSPPTATIKTSCRRYPPTGDTIASFPLVSAGNWCGEWKQSSALGVILDIDGEQPPDESIRKPGEWFDLTTPA